MKALSATTPIRILNATEQDVQGVRSTFVPGGFSLGGSSQASADSAYDPWGSVTVHAIPMSYIG